MELARPYVAAFSARFLVMLQYRAAALAGFTTQCWWGAIKVMVYSAFYHSSPAAATAPMGLTQVITYTWLAQAFLMLSPGTDSEVAIAVRTGTIGYDRLRPVDTFWLWYVRGAAGMSARAAPRAALMLVMTALLFPVIGLGAWGWAPPPSIAAGALFALSMVLVVALASAISMVLNVAVIAILNDKGVNNLLAPLTVVLSGNLMPLALYPDWMQVALFVQPFAGLVDIPFRIYSGNLAGGVAWAGIGLQAFWTLAFVVAGRIWLDRVMRRLEMQGG